MGKQAIHQWIETSIHFTGHCIATSKKLCTMKLILCCLLVRLTSALADQCAEHCDCETTPERFRALKCSYQSVDEFRDSELPPRVLRLSVSFTQHVNLNEQSFADKDYFTLETLVLENCNIGSISERSFSPFRNLLNLQLFSNRIESIDSGAFVGLENLSALNLTSNTVTSVGDESFSGLSLDVLHLRDNSVPTLTAQSFSGLQARRLNLSANKLTRITSKVLEPLKSELREISILDNGLTLDIDEDTFKNTNLQVLQISQHSSTQCNFLRYVRTVTLDLSSNQLHSTDFNTFPSLVSVQRANLSNIGIEYLSEHKFESLSGLRELDLSHNNIFILDGEAFSELRRLRTLLLDHNPIIRISRHFGASLGGLEDLSLRGCQLAELADPEPFLPMSSLQKLDLGRNLIQVRGAGRAVNESQVLVCETAKKYVHKTSTTF